MLARLICLILDHVFYKPPTNDGEHIYGPCCRCHRFVVLRAR